MAQKNDKIEEGEVVGQSSISDSVSTELVLESRIKQYLGDIERLRSKIQEKKDMFDSAFENDSIYMKHKETLSEAKKQLQKTKSEMIKIEAISLLNSQLKELKDEMKDLQDGLSISLSQFREQTGQTSITRDDGEVYEIVTMLKLKKRV